MTTTSLIILVFCAALAALVVADLVRGVRRVGGRPMAPGSLPMARGFEAIRQTHGHRTWGGAGNGSRFNPWQAARDKRLGLVPADAEPLYPECP